MRGLNEMNTDAKRNRKRRWLRDMWIALRDAVIATIISTTIAVIANLVHPEAIPFIAEEEYEILVPCPEPGGEVIPLEPSDSGIWAPNIFLVDARSKKDFTAWHFEEATNLTYDYLDPTPENLIHDLALGIARSKSTKVVVYGDGDVPDTGEQLGKEISGHGIKNVFFLTGGAPALMKTKAPGGGK